MTVLDPRALNRATLARQLLLDRADLPVPDAGSWLGGLQAQETQEPFVGLWSRLRGFDPMVLSKLLTERQVVRAHLMHRTVHLVTSEDYLGLRARHAAMLRQRVFGVYRRELAGVDPDALAAAGRAVLADEQPRSMPDLGRGGRRPLAGGGLPGARRVVGRGAAADPAAAARAVAHHPRCPAWPWSPTGWGGRSIRCPQRRPTGSARCWCGVTWHVRWLFAQRLTGRSVASACPSRRHDAALCPGGPGVLRICGRLMDSHWVHRRATYRCRHGYNSARSKPASSRPKILYVREDHVLARIQLCRQLLRQRPELAGADPETIADHLHTNNMIIVCDHDAWVLETDTATIPLAAATGLLLATTAKIPAQRKGDQQERDQTPRSVWN